MKALPGYYPYLVAGAVLGLVFALGVAGPARRVDELRGALATINGQIQVANASIQETLKLERESSRMRMQLAYRHHAGASPLVWFPEEMSRFFEQFGIRDVSTRVNTGEAESGIPGYQRTFWAVALPLRDGATEMDRAILAISELERADRLLRVHSVSASASAGSNVLGGRTATVTVSLLTRRF
jgi:hypothetical protein